MKFRNIVLALAVCLGIAFTAHAQTYTVLPGLCGAYNTATYYCSTMEISKADGSVFGFFYEPMYNGRLNHVAFYGQNGSMGLDGLGQLNVTSITTYFDGSVDHQTTTFAGTDSSGAPVTGVIAITYTTYRGTSGGGKGGGSAGQKWTITGGTISVTRNAATTASVASPS